MTWKVPCNSFLRRYYYTYEGMNRLSEDAYSHLPVLSPFPGIISSIEEEILSTGESSPLSLIPVINTPGDLVGPISINAADQYTERLAYDKNSNITSLKRYGMNNQRHYGLIDSLVITRNGNQLKTIEDYAQKHLTYTGASDFYDGYSYNTEYYYNANGALESDINRDIELIQYDDLGNTRCIYYFGQNQIEYVYAADGTKLRTIHRPASSSALTDSIDYIGNLILKNGQPSMYLFDGGFASFDANGAVDRWHYYIQDYMGNNRMVVNRNDTTEQVTHYYPYGGVIGDISTNENVQKYKFEDKELDRTFGLDNYDIHARQYFAMMPSWDRIDPLAEDSPQFSPYSYCMGNPVNLGDYNGCEVSGATRYDATRIVNDLRSLFPGDEFEQFRKLISQSGKNHKGKSLAKIDNDDLNLALEGVNLTDDQQALLEMVTNTINSSDKHVIEYVSEQSNLTTKGANAVLNDFEKAGLPMNTIMKANGGIPAILVSTIGGGGLTVQTKTGTYSLIMTNSELHPLGISVTVGHELLGHGRSLALGRGHANQHMDAIQTENLILRVMGINFINNGINHGPRTVITNATEIPMFR